MVSPAFNALAPRTKELTVGAVLSNVTEPVPVVTAVPALPARSENAIL